MAARAPLTIGVLGTGSTSRKQAASAVSDKISGGRAKFILPVTEAHYSAAVKAIADFARRNEYPYEVIVDDTTDDVEDVEDLLDEATKTHKVVKVATKLVSLIEAAGEKGVLALAWDDEDEDCSAALELASAKGMKAYDLTQAMEDIELGEEGDDEADDDSEDEDEPKVVDSGPVEMAPAAAEEEAQDEPESPADEAQADLVGESTNKLVFGAAGLLEALLVELRRIVREEVTEATKPRPRGRPRKDGQPAGSSR